MQTEHKTETLNSLTFARLHAENENIKYSIAYIFKGDLDQPAKWNKSLISQLLKKEGTI